MLNIDEFLVDHEGDTACGENLEYDSLLLEVREAIEGKPAQQIGDDVIEGIEPDWKLVKKNCLILCKQTHSLEVIISLIQALMNLEGFSGFADGSKLLKNVIDKYWTCIHPQLDPDDIDPIERLNKLAIFEDFNFLLSLQKIQLLSSKGVGTVNLYDIFNAKSPNDDENDGKGIDPKLIDAIFKSCSQEDKEQAYSYLEKSAANFKSISSFLIEEETVGASNAPSFNKLLKILNEAKSAVGVHLNHKTENVNDFNDIDDSSTQSVAGSSGNVKSSGINTRQDVISSIEKIEEYYQNNEPGSPIPLLLQRAKSLVDKDFIALMEDLSPDSLNQLMTILGSNKSKNSDE